MALQIRTLKELKQKTTPKMICPKVLILTLFIVGTFAKDSKENMEERIEALEKELAEAKMETIESNKRFKAIEKKLERFEALEMTFGALTKADDKKDSETNNLYLQIEVSNF